MIALVMIALWIPVLIRWTLGHQLIPELLIQKIHKTLWIQRIQKYRRHTSDTQDTEDTNDHEDTSVPETDDDGDGVTVEGGDCDDSNPNIPGDEYCDGVDNDCDGQTDEADAIDVLTWYIDQDGDGFGEATTTMEACDQPTGYADG